MQKLLFLSCSSALILGAHAWTYSARNYVQRGLMAHYDAVENTGYGTHDANATKWTNITGNKAYSDLPIKGVISTYKWLDRGLALTTGNHVSPQKLIMDEPVTVNTFTIETIVRSGSNDTELRRFEIYPWDNKFETWANQNEGYLERLKVNDSNLTRFSALKSQQNNTDMSFSTTYDGYTHFQHVHIGNSLYTAKAKVTNFSMTERLAFCGNFHYEQGTEAGPGSLVRAIRVYNCQLEEAEIAHNYWLDQVRLQGVSPNDAVRPEGWSVDENGILYDENGVARIRPNESVLNSEREITAAKYSLDENNHTICTVTFAEGSPNTTNALYIAWSDHEQTDNDIKAWPKVLRIALIPPDVNSITFSVPADCVGYAENVYTRLFVTESAVPYDYLLEYIAVTGNQWYDTPYFANPNTIAGIDLTLNDTTVQQRPFGADHDIADGSFTFSFSTYINGGGCWAFACQDNSGNWTASTCSSKKERVKLRVDANPGGSCNLSINSDSYHGQFASAYTTRTKTANVGLCLFASARLEGSHSNPLRNAYIYNMYITEHGKDYLLHNYYPCSIDGRAALYDAATDEICYSSTETDFLPSSANTSASVVIGENILNSFQLGLIPHEFYSINTVSTPTTIDYQLAYSKGGEKYGVAPLTLTHTDNAFGGTFTVKEGLLNADFGAGLGTEDNLVINGGSWGGVNGSAKCSLGTGASQVSLTGNIAGFGAYNQDTAVQLSENAGATITYPSDNFDMTTLLLNDSYCNNTLTFLNAIAGDGNMPTLNLRTDSGTSVLAYPITGVNLARSGLGKVKFTSSEYSLGKFTVDDNSITEIGTPDVAQPVKVDVSSDFLVNRHSTMNLENAEVNVSGNAQVKPLAKMVMSNTTLTVANTFHVVTTGDNETSGYFVMDGGSINAKSLNFGAMSGWAHYYSNVILTNNPQITVQYLTGYVGDLYQYSGDVKVTSSDTGSLQLGSAGSINGWGTFSYYLYGGTLERVSSSGNFQVGHSGTNATGCLYVEGTGHLITHCQDPSIGRWRHNYGKLYVRNGGLYDSFDPQNDQNLWISDEGHGYLEVASGGIVNCTGNIACCPSSYTHAERTAEIQLLTGGLIKTKSCYTHSSIESRKCTKFIWNGGTFQVNDSPRNPFISDFNYAYFGNNGGYIDTNGKDVSITQDFTTMPNQTWKAPTTADEVASCGAFTKLGVGTLSISGNNSYACATCVSNGVLKTITESALPTTGLVKTGAEGTLDLNGTKQTIGDLAGVGTIKNGLLDVTGTIWTGLGVDTGSLKLDNVTLTLKNIHATVQADGKCGKVVTNGRIDLNDTTVEISGLDNIPANGHSLAILEATILEGKPTCLTELPAKYSLQVSGNKLMLSSGGFAVYLR